MRSLTAVVMFDRIFISHNVLVVNITESIKHIQPVFVENWKRNVYRIIDDTRGDFYGPIIMT